MNASASALPNLRASKETISFTKGMRLVQFCINSRIFARISARLAFGNAAEQSQRR